MAKKTAPPASPRRRTAAAPRRSTDATSRSVPDTETTPLNDLALTDRAQTDLSHDDIAQEAYLRFLDRGGSGGQELDDWLDAERELKKRNNGG